MVCAAAIRNGATHHRTPVIVVCTVDETVTTASIVRMVYVVCHFCRVSGFCVVGVLTAIYGNSGGRVTEPKLLFSVNCLYSFTGVGGSGLCTRFPIVVRVRTRTNGVYLILLIFLPV